MALRKRSFPRARISRLVTGGSTIRTARSTSRSISAKGQRLSLNWLSLSWQHTTTMLSQLLKALEKSGRTWRSETALSPRWLFRTRGSQFSLSRSALPTLPSKAQHTKGISALQCRIFTTVNRPVMNSHSVWWRLTLLFNPSYKETVALARISCFMLTLRR